MLLLAKDLLPAFLVANPVAIPVPAAANPAPMPSLVKISATKLLGVDPGLFFTYFPTSLSPVKFFAAMIDPPSKPSKFIANPFAFKKAVPNIAAAAVVNKGVKKPSLSVFLFIALSSLDILSKY